MSAALRSKVEDSMCHVAADSDLAELIRKVKLIISNEALMVNRYCYEAFDSTLHDIYRIDTTVASDKVFVGKVVFFGGDFRQILPVITNGGNGKGGGTNDGMSTVVFPDNMLIPETNDDEKSIFAPTHEMVDIINQRMLSLLIGDEKDYESSDSVCLADDDSSFDDSIYTTEFLNEIRVVQWNKASSIKNGIKRWFVFKEARIFTWTTICSRLASKEQKRIKGALFELLLLLFVRSLPWRREFKRRKQDDVLDWLQMIFGFQKANVANQREHLILLLENAHVRQTLKPNQKSSLAVGRFKSGLSSITLIVSRGAFL
uniref:ATP-dependent DNA helicase n=1 Tax=Tanacetum cinerariifolium TaxID=118510 RepID=A0A699HR00_TANCI|nr:ATP-dependent DNA helicase PIF1-like [Tanacetum cinerariifolium]